MALKAMFLRTRDTKSKILRNVDYTCDNMLKQLCNKIITESNNALTTANNNINFIKTVFVSAEKGISNLYWIIPYRLQSNE